MPTTQEIYASARQMPPAEQLRLAARLLEDVAGSLAQIDGEYTDEDLRLAANHALEYAARIYGDEDELLPAPSAGTVNR